MPSLLDLFNIVSSYLPQVILSICAGVLFFAFILKYLINNFVIPAVPFFSSHILNRNIYKLLKIINDKNICDEQLKKECKIELSIIQKMEKTQCRDRLLALYFYDLTNLTQHKISYTQFKRLYRYLKILDENISISSKTIKYDNFFHALFSLPFILLFLFYDYLLFFQADSVIKIIIYIFTLIVFLLYIIFLLGSIIKKNEIKEFITIKNIFFDKLKFNLELNN